MALLEAQTITMPDGTKFAGQRISPEAGIIFGGAIASAADFAHLQQAFGVTHVLNVCAEKDAGGFGIPPANLSQQPIPDSGTSPSSSWYTAVAAFIAAARAVGGTVYIMSLRGVSRAPLAYLTHMVINKNVAPTDAVATVKANVQPAVQIGSAGMSVQFGVASGHQLQVQQLKSVAKKN